MNGFLRALDDRLNGITMYRLLAYGLSVVLAVAVFYSFTGALPLSGPALLASIAVLVVSCYATNRLLGKLYGAPVNSESYFITALILACILPSSLTASRLAYLGLAGILAMASKYVLAWHHRHIFNPAAIAAVIISLLGLMSVTWWVGSPYMVPFAAGLGFLVLRKLRRFSLFFVFTAAALGMMAMVGAINGQPVDVLIKNALLSGPLIFFATIMLTEPATIPSSRYYQLLYGFIVGALYSAQLRFGLFSTSPHMVLAIGNIFAFAVNPRYTLKLKLRTKHLLFKNAYDYVFTPDRSITFLPGQYMEWTLPHRKADRRGNRRTFTIASSPTEKEVHLGVKFYEPSSSFKRALQSMRPGDTIAAGHTAGDFVLPADPAQKLVFIAGGIGITPFRSMLQYVVDSKQKRSITLFYIVNTPQELAYDYVFAAAKSYGLKVVPIISAAKPDASWKGYTGMLTDEIITREVPDFAQRTYYISGPTGLVRAYKGLLKKRGVAGKQIVTDYFPGY